MHEAFTWCAYGVPVQELPVEYVLGTCRNTMDESQVSPAHALHGSALIATATCTLLLLLLLHRTCTLRSGRDLAYLVCNSLATPLSTHCTAVTHMHCVTLRSRGLKPISADPLLARANSGSRRCCSRWRRRSPTPAGTWRGCWWRSRSTGLTSEPAIQSVASEPVIRTAAYC